MAEKTYYWLKFQKDFFKSLRIKRLRKLAGGDTFTIIYLKLQLLSLATEGYLEYKGIFDSFEEEMAEEIGEDAENIKITVQYLLSCGLMELNPDEGEYFLPYVPLNTGKETSEAKRLRQYREKKALQECTNVQKCNNNVQKCNTEKEIEKEKDKDIYIVEQSIDSIKEIVAYMNEVWHKNYKYQTPKTQNLIRTRLKEGFTVEDFKRVIDHRYSEWGRDEKMAAYLRPETVFGTKFESYLNNAPQPRVIVTEDTEDDEPPIDFWGED